MNPIWSSRPRNRGEGQFTGLVGRDTACAIPLTEDRYVVALQVKEVNDVDTKGSGRADGGRPVRLPSHDLGHARVEGGREQEDYPTLALLTSGGTTALAGARSGAERRLLRPRLGAAAASRVQPRVRFDPPSFEWARHQGTSRDWVQIPAEGLQAQVQESVGGARQRRRHRHRSNDRTSSCTPIPCCRRTSRSSRSSRTCTRRESGCVSRPSGATTSRR